MKAVVLCAGRGTRLGDLTAEQPKAMLSVAGRPLLEHAIRNLARQEVRQIGVNLWYRGEAIEEHFGDGSRWGVEITYCHERELSGTAGALRGFDRFLAGEPSFLVIYGDLLTDQDFRPLLESHRTTGAALTMMVHRRPGGSNSIVELDADGRVTRFHERPETPQPASADGSWVNSGIYLVSQEVLERIPDAGEVDFPRDVFPELLREGALYAEPVTGYRCAIDSAERLEVARRGLPASFAGWGEKA